MHEDVTEDRLLGGRVRLRQPARGFRAAIDSVLLGAAVDAPAGAAILEAGCGVGAALLCAAVQAPHARFVGVEREIALAEIARGNVSLNGLAGRVEIECADVLTGSGPIYDGVFCNPPFDDAAGAQRPEPERANSYLSEYGVDVWVRRLADRLKGGAALTMIHRAERLAAILAAMEGRLGGVQVFPVRPRTDEPAKRVLVRARKGARAPLRLLKGLDLHERANGAKYTPEAEGILRGGAQIDWGA